MHGPPIRAKITQMFSRKWLAVPLVGSALALSACGGGPAFGDVEGQVLAMRSAAEQPALLKDASVLIAGNGIDCGKRVDFCAAKSDANGKYAFKDVPAGTYAIAFNTPSSGDAKLQEETRQFSVTANAVETVSVVLLADGLTRPEVPAELAQQRPNQQGGGGYGGGGGLTSNPFFWYWMFNQPWIGGYSRAPVVVMSPDRTVAVDRSQPAASANGRPYSNYSPDGARGTKSAPVSVDSKGVTRPGSAALPGSSSGASARQPSSPPRVGAGGGSTAPRRASPPRVRVGRR